MYNPKLEDYDIDWDLVESLFQSGETSISISDHLKVKINIFRCLFKDKFDLNFLEYKKKHGIPIKKVRLVPIDWDLVRTRLTQGCNFKEIALELGFMSAQGFSKRCDEDLGMSLKEVQLSCRSKGDNMLHATQFKKAIDGDTTMLTWLGKNRLKQTDKVEVKDNKVETLDLFLDGLRKLDPSVFDKKEGKDGLSTKSEAT